MKKTLFSILGVIVLLFIAWFAFIYFVPYSEGTRSGELIKFSKKGVISKRELEEAEEIRVSIRPPRFLGRS